MNKWFAYGAVFPLPVNINFNQNHWLSGISAILLFFCFALPQFSVSTDCACVCVYACVIVCEICFPIDSRMLFWKIYLFLWLLSLSLLLSLAFLLYELCTSASSIVICFFFFLLKANNGIHSIQCVGMFLY